MKRHKRARALLSVVGIFFLSGAFTSGRLCLAKTDVLDIFVSIPPQAYLVNRVGGNLVKVHTLAEKGQDPHTFEPTPKQVIDLGNAKYYFTIGLPFEERLMAKIKDSSRKLAIIDISRGITRRMMSPDDKESEKGKAAHGHPQRDPDPHVWLSPPLLKIMAANIADALSTAAPEYRDDFRRNLIALDKDIDTVHNRIKEILKPFSGQTFLVYHPAFGYFGDTYGLHEEAVEQEGKSPSPKYLAQLISRAKADKARIIFVQPQFDKTSAKVIADAINGVVVKMDPLGYDVLDNLDHIAAEIEQSFAAK
jgi:zinc transport system substrate-binding protein